MKYLIHKFKTIENAEILIPAIISGGNGKGKSTILEAISFVHSGKDLNGNEFKQVYDNRVDLHDAIADVSYFDNYGNEFRRVVKPIFQTNRQGIEEVKIKRSTECFKNGIACNDFASEFTDFYKFGTDYFFRQKEADQRAIFIDILKSKMPDYDVKSASLKVKELKKAQKIEVEEIKRLNMANAETKDVPVPVIDVYLSQLNNDYLSLSAADNSELIAEINRKNNQAMDAYLKEKSRLSTEITNTEIEISKLDAQIKDIEDKISTVQVSQFVPKEIDGVEELTAKLEVLRKQLSECEYFETLEAFAKKHLESIPSVVANRDAIVNLTSDKKAFTPNESENLGACPLNGEFCETAKLYGSKAQQEKHNARIDAKIEDLRKTNRTILEREMHDINRKFQSVKSDVQEVEQRILKIEESNRLLNSENAKDKNIFELEKSGKLTTLIDSLSRAKIQNEALEATLKEKRGKLEALLQPTPERLPEALEISAELVHAHEEFERLNREIIGAIAINANNSKNRAKNEETIKEKQQKLFEIGEELVSLESEITDYFSNLKGVIKSEFAGDIEIDVQLQDFVMSRNEYDDCFKITADGKVFPYECNGALQNNVKLQILNSFQRLINYTGVTILDNCEANTTQPINTLKTNAVLAFATKDEVLTIK